MTGRKAKCRGVVVCQTDSLRPQRAYGTPQADIAPADFLSAKVRTF